MKPQKTILILAIILFANILQAQQSILTKEITINKSQISSSELIRTLQTETGFSINYSRSVLKIPQNIKLEKDEATFKYYLDKIFGQQQVEYIVKGQKILVRLKAVKQNHTNKNAKTISISGKVTDKQSGAPISYATISIKNQAIGTVTNTEGGFVFHVPNKYINDSLIVSSIGYKSYGIQIAQIKSKPLNIILEKKIYDLSEVKVKPKNALEIVKQAIAQIPENYPTEPIYLNGYYRELIKVDTTFVKYNDAACKYYYCGYNEPYNKKQARKLFNNYTAFNTETIMSFPKYNDKIPHPQDKVKIIEARASDNLQQFKEYWNLDNFINNLAVGGGPISITASDKVKHLTDFFNKKKLKRYKFTIKDISEYNGKSAYVILFKPKGKSAKVIWEGKLYIDIKSLAIIAYEYKTCNSHRKYIKKHNLKMIVIFNKKKIEETGKKYAQGKITQYDHKVRVEYAFYKDKWYLNRIKNEDYYITTGDLLTEKKQESISELVINNIETENVKPFKKNEVFRSMVSNYLCQYPLTYDPKFWANYNAIIPTGIFGKALKDIEKDKDLNKQFKDKVYQDTSLQAPIAKKIPQLTYIHNDTLIDNYYWLKNKSNKDVNEYIKKENEYTNNYMIPLKKKQRYLYYEMIDRIEKDYKSLPNKIDSYFYYSKYSEGDKYEKIYRKKDTINAKEELIMDINRLAKGNPYFSIDGITISTNHNIIAYIENTTGGFENIVRFKNITNGTLISDSLINVADLVWANDNKTLFYTKMDSTYRSCKVYKHILNASGKPNKLIFEETDNTFYVSLRKSKSKKIIFISTSSSNENETLFTYADTPDSSFKYIQKRILGHKYSVSHYKDAFYILTNHDAINFKLVSTPVTKPGMDNWKVIIPHKTNRMLNNFAIFKDYLVIEEQENMESGIRVISRLEKKEYKISFDEDKYYNINLGYNPVYDTDSLQIIYTSATAPTTIYKYNMLDKQKTIAKQQKVIGGYSLKDYKAERHYAIAKDGKKIPITLVYKKKWKSKYEKRKLLIKAYGAYGIGSYPQFSSSDLSLLDRGYTIAIAHVRGGDELGQQWYEDGKLLNKKNTFNDFIACTEYLISKGFSKKGQVLARGGSAGGMLMGVVANERPDLFKALILDVPFLDVLNTMLDKSRPLTTGEFKEWGNPKEKKYYDYIKSYSPYNNIKKQNYPNMLFIAYLNDNNAPYWEAAKTVAKLRAANTSENKILLKVYNVGGHAGGSGRFDNYIDKSFQYTFLMDMANEYGKTPPNKKL